MKRVLIFLALILSLSSYAQWSVEKANQWYNSYPWLCGVNYIPAYAINYTAMWDRTSFDAEAISKELTLMKDMGMNCVRVVLQYVVFEDDDQIFLKNFESFLSLCSDNGIYVMPIFFDDCAFGTNTDPKAGKQPEPLEGWYAWAWSPSPGLTMVVDTREHVKLEKFVKSVMTKFKDDSRILAWDLYNEPTNSSQPKYSWPLIRSVFKWAREVNPSQPITTGIWNEDKELNEFLAANSDIITFHNYGDPASLNYMLNKSRDYASGRPVICTEWMNRKNNSTIKNNLHIFRENGVGCMLWGLVNGKTQTHLCWGHRPSDLPFTGIWQHDLFHGDFTPYDSTEIEIIKRTTMNKYMKMAIDEAREGFLKQHGGPFGSVIVKNGNVVGSGHNRVLINNDPSCHGEIDALRNACKNLGTYDLSGCELYTTGEPCHMCLCACMWANIDKIYYGCTIEDNGKIGFRDDKFNQIFSGREKLKDYLIELNRDECLKLFDEYIESQHTIY